MRKLSLAALVFFSCSNPGAVSADRSSLSASPTSLAADGFTRSIVTVVARDSTGATLSGAQVSLSVAGGSDFMLDPGTSQTTLSNGAAQFNLTATSAGTYTLSASINSVALTHTATVVFTAGSGTSLVVRVQPTSVQVGQVLAPPVVVEAHDSKGNLAPGFTGMVAIALTSPNGATLAGTPQVAAVAGAATFADLRINKPGNYTLIATAMELSAVNTDAFDVTAGPPAKLVYVNPPVGTAAGATLGPVVVAARDADGNPLPGNTAQITIAIGNGPSGATLNGTKTVAAVDGVATFTGLSLPVAGDYTLAVTAAGLAGATSPTFTISGGAATHLSFTMQPSTAEVRTGFPADVTVQDAQGNTVATGAVTVTLASNLGTLAGTTSLATVGGVAHFSGLSFSDEGSATLTASANTLTSATSNAITVTDTTAPAQPTLSVSGKTATTATLSWSEVGDDGVLGTATSQDLRWSTSAITTANFMQATAVTTPAVAAAGTGQTASVTGLTASTPYFFALRVVDSAGNAALGTATATTDTCPAGFIGATCTQCDVGYLQTDAGVCSDLCLPDPCTTPPAAGCSGNVATTYPAVGTCGHNAAGTTCTYPPMMTDCTASGGVCANGSCIAVHPPGAGDLIVSEVMHTSSLGLAGQWVELVSLSSDRIELANVKLETVGSGGTAYTLPATSHVIAPHAIVVLGGSTDTTANGGAAVDLAWSGIDLSTLKHVKISLGTTVIDDVDVGALAPPSVTDQAVQVSQLALAPGGEQQSWYWCGATAPLSGGGLGTPGQPNGTCGMTLAPPVDYCVVQFPKTLGALDAPVAANVYGQFFEPSVTDRNHNGNDNYPLVVGELGWGAPDAGATAWTWSRAPFNASYVDSDPNTDNDEVVGVFAPTLSGSYLYGYRFRMIDPATGVASANQYCDQNGPVTDLTAATWGTATVLAPSADLAAARAAPDGPGQSLSINGARVTYVRATIGNDLAGFFLQADPTGPALFVAVDPATLTPSPVVGDRVALTLTSMADAGLAREALAVTGYARISSGNDVTGLIQDVSDAGDLVSNVTGYESELTRTSGTLSGGLVSAGTGFLGAPFSTAGVPSDPNLTVRLPQTVTDALDLTQGCAVTVTAPMGRFNAKAEVSGWAAADVVVNACPAPNLVAARTGSPTSVLVTFDRVLDGATLAPNGSQFTSSGGLTVSAATLSAPTEVTLTTSTQAMNTNYTLTVSGSLHDLYGKGCVPPGNTTIFAGPGACMPSQVVISQVYGGGGNSGAPYQNDFIELHNRSTSAAAIGGWSVQYASSMGSSWNVTSIPANTMLAPGAYFLIQEAAGTGTAPALPTPDATGTIAMSATAAKVALVAGTTALTGACPLGGSVQDFVGYGTGTTCSEGTIAPAPSATKSILRGSMGCTDSDMNSTDFTAQAPAPHNTAATANSCGCN